MANNNLEGAVTQANLVAKANALQDALTGGLFPRSVAGQPVAGDGSLAPDIGSATNNWDAIYVRRIIAGGVELDLSALSQGTTVGIITESEATYAWAFTATKALFIIVSGASGAGGGGSGADVSMLFYSDNNNVNIRGAKIAGSAGAAGHPTSLTHIRTGETYKTHTPTGGLGGDGVAGENIQIRTIARNNSAEAAFNAYIIDDEYTYSARNAITLTPTSHDLSNTGGGRGGIRASNNVNVLPPNYSANPGTFSYTSLIGGKGWPGGVSIHRTIIDDIRPGDEFNIALGAGGLGGVGAPLNSGGRAGNNPEPRAGGNGSAGNAGYIIIIPINETEA